MKYFIVGVLIACFTVTVASSKNERELKMRIASVLKEKRAIVGVALEISCEERQSDVCTETPSCILVVVFPPCRLLFRALSGRELLGPDISAPERHGAQHGR